ncbi:PPP family 3-phenylpropionic acid transporter [Evansella vedderi]|uniref:PPP family 3-phenylpropionic acid transporter n=1 Tax=Evansella vedderi TaxID=38282 RepID=A0ABU0A241_9BACI|nr:MFS transporter [Evansella vedderi]MDQ0257549.1 PPP family 3-phenylpropionic acid transporter [Evansella vedderi]
MNSIWKLKGMLFFFHSSMTIIVSYLPVYLQVMGLTGSQIGVLLAVGPAAAIIAQPFWGFMSDKWKTVKRVLIICISGTLALGFILFQLTEYLLLIPMMYLLFSFAAPAGGLGDSLSQKVSVKYGVSFGSIRLWGSLGFALASLAGGFILSHIGITNIYYLFAFFLSMALIFCLLAPDGEPAKKPVQLTNALKLLKSPKLMTFLLMVMAIGLTHRMNDSFLGLYIVELGGNESYIGMSWFIGVVTEAVVFALSFYWLRSFHPLTLINIAAFLYFIRWVLMSFVPDPTFVLYIQVLHGICFAILYLTAFQFVTRLVPDELESTGHLLYISVFFGISGVIGSIIGGQIMSAFDLRTLYVVMAGLAAVGLGGSILYRISYFRSEDGKNEMEKLKETSN